MNGSKYCYLTLVILFIKYFYIIYILHAQLYGFKCCMPYRHNEEMNWEAWRKNDHYIFFYITLTLYFSKGVVAGEWVRETDGEKRRRRQTTILTNNFFFFWPYNAVLHLCLFCFPTRGHSRQQAVFPPGASLRDWPYLNPRLQIED